MLAIVVASQAELAARARAQATEGAAPDAAARAAFEAGRDAYDHGQFAEALTQFERAYALSPHAKLLFNIARAAEADGRTTRAIEAYEGYLAALPQAENREFVEARLTKLRATPASPAAAPAAIAEPAAAAPIAPEPASAPAAPIAAAPTSMARHDEGEPKPFWKKGWFWGVVGVVVVGAVTTGIVLSVDRGDPERAPADLRVFTLGAR